jgi:hypothetical protein
MATETVGFMTREAREGRYKEWKAEGSTGLGRHTTHIDADSAIVYVLTRFVPAAVEPEGTSLKVPLTESQESEKMVSEGGNSNENEGQQIEPVAARD